MRNYAINMEFKIISNSQIRKIASDMTTTKKRLINIGGNLILVSLAFMYLFSEHRRVGKFQWVDPHAIEDNEELYLTPIFVAVLILGIISVIHEAMKFRKNPPVTSIGRTSHTILENITTIYAALLVFAGFILIVMILGSIGNHGKVYIPELLLFLLIPLYIGLLGGFMISSNLNKKGSR